jgi:hypothetical protein
MANNIPKYSSNVRQSLQDIPDNLFEMGKEDVAIKANLLQRQYNKDPNAFAKIIQRLINEDKRSRT